MPFMLNIQLGGLCMLVEADNKGSERDTKPDNEPGLFVLMPQFDSPHGPHKPLMVYSGVHTGQKEHELTRQEVPIAGHIIPLRGLSGVQPIKRTLPPSITRVSAFGGKPVDPRFLRGNLAPGVLTRIELDLGIELVPCGSPADLRVTLNGQSRPTKGLGRVSVTFQ